MSDRVCTACAAASDGDAVVCVHAAEPMFHGTRTKWKLVRSGQVRTYWKGACACGWEAQGFRVTEERAEADHAAHVAELGLP